MIVLGLDTATMTASVAVLRDGAVVAAADVETPMHSDVLLPAIDDTVRRAGVTPRELDAIAVGAGPGSFTGLRIGMATAKGIAFAAARPLWIVSSLGALALDAAAAAPAGVLLVPALDARRGEIYIGFYRVVDATVRAVAPERVVPAAAFADTVTAARGDDAGDAIAFGDALATHAIVAGPAQHVRPDLRRTPSGAAVARLALAGDRADALDRAAPVYIRPAEAEVKYPDGVPGALRRR